MSNSEIYLSKNETLRSIRNRRSVRMFLDKAVSDDDLRIILHAANHAPSAHNQQSWRFVVLRGKKKAELANLVNAMADSFPKPSCVLLRLASRSIVSVAGVPVGYAAKENPSPKKRSLEMVVRYLGR